MIFPFAPQNICKILAHSAGKSILLALDNVLESHLVSSVIQCGSTFQRLQFVSGMQSYFSHIWCGSSLIS